MRRENRFKFVLAFFEKNNPDADTELHFGSPYELLVAVILSAQCTDVRVNKITPALFAKYPDVYALSEAKEEEIFELIRSCSYPNNKTKHLKGMAVKIVDLFMGVVPSEINDLQLLPGVGRKTANVIASVIYHKPAMAVDTHVHRVSARIGLTVNSKTPLETEKQLIKYIPENKIAIAHHWLILHGRYVCKARKPLCNECGLVNYCVYYKKNKILC